MDEPPFSSFLPFEDKTSFAFYPLPSSNLWTPYSWLVPLPGNEEGKLLPRRRGRGSAGFPEVVTVETQNTIRKAASISDAFLKTRFPGVGGWGGGSETGAHTTNRKYWEYLQSTTQGAMAVHFWIIYWTFSNALGSLGPRAVFTR